MLADLRAPWWFAGGWAIDLFLGGTQRTHEDLDVGCFRRDVRHVIGLLAGWDVRAPVHGALVPIEREVPIHADVHNLWCRPEPVSCWVLEILLEDSDGPEWVYRRDPRIRRADRDIIAHTAAGLPFLRPEIQLLYKAEDSRPRDEVDFQAAWRHLWADQRAWLMASIAATVPGHPWLLTDGAG